MKFIATPDGYINVKYVRRLIALDKRIAHEDNSNALYFMDEEFADEESEQSYWDELIDELEGDSNID